MTKFIGPTQDVGVHTFEGQEPFLIDTSELESEHVIGYHYPCGTIVLYGEEIGYAFTEASGDLEVIVRNNAFVPNSRG